VEVFEIKLHKHENADNLEVVFVDGYPSCVRKGQFKDGDLAYFIPPDNIVPDTPEFEFLVGKRHIKARKLRGVPSFGLIMPAPAGANVGDDVAQQLGIVHYEPPLSGGNTGGEIEKGPHGYIPHYDLDSFRKYSKLFVEGEPVWASEKCHGAQGKFKYDSTEGRMFAGSKKEWKKFDPENLWWKALTYTPTVEKFCRNHANLTLFGEVVGQVQKGFDYGVPKGECRILGFDIFTPTGWMNPADTYNLAMTEGLPWVPIILKDFPYNFDKLIGIAESKSNVPGANHISEGLVVSPKIERNDYKLGRVKLKIVSMAYLERK
jgi:RNA ligase (TIGR02306 family)